MWGIVFRTSPPSGSAPIDVPYSKLATDTDIFGTATAAQPPAATVSPSTADEIAKLAALRDSGAITPAELDSAKAKALA